MSDLCQIIDGTGWSRGFRSRAAAERRPVSATLELTSRCNLRCQHCYLGNQDEQHAKRELERDTAAVIRSLDEWAAAGCLYLLITGGDPMMRPDFEEVYRHAAGLGMVITVFCDGILVTGRIVGLFREFPPRRVEISIYGATAGTYETVTRVPGSHARAWQGIHRLLDNGIRVGLKTVVMTLNRHELEAMAEQARELGCRFRYDASIFPCFPGGSGSPLDLRIAPEETVRLDMAVPEQRDHWERAVRAAHREPSANSDQLYTCGAGVTSFCSDPFGWLSPCMMTRRYRYPGEGRAFLDVWQNELAEIRGKKRTRDTLFNSKMRGACTHCPAVNDLETGDEEIESDYIETTTRLRYEAVMGRNETDA